MARHYDERWPAHPRLLLAGFLTTGAPAFSSTPADLDPESG
jgi:hypothetical protein